MAMQIDPQIVERFEALAGPDVADGLERNGLEGAAEGVLPLWPDCRKIVGPAQTLKLVPPGEGPESAAYDTLRAVVASGQGSVLVIDNGSRPTVNSFGGIVGTTSKHYGVAGCVSDGAMRDINEYKALDFPCYASGPALTSIRTRSSSAGYGIEVIFAGLAVRPGDLVFGDENGVLIVPRDHIEAVLETAELVKRTEERIIAAIRGGQDPVAAHEAVHYDQMLAET